MLGVAISSNNRWSGLASIYCDVGRLWRWTARDNDIVEAFLAHGSEGECENTDGEAHDANASDGVLEQIRPSGADESG